MLLCKGTLLQNGLWSGGAGVSPFETALHLTLLRNGLWSGGAGCQECTMNKIVPEIRRFMAGKVTMSTIAKKLGVSKNTVSLALRGAGGISEKTRRLVVETAAKMGYSYKSLKRLLKAGICVS